MVRAALPVSKLRARRRRRRVVVALIIAVLFLVIAGIAIIFSWMPFLRVQNIEISGVSSVNPELVESNVKETLQGARWYVFAKDNTFLYPKREIEEHLLSKFPIFASAAVSQRGFDTLELMVVERTSKALWCGASLASSSPYYLLDKDGVAYAPAADYSSEIYVKYYGALSGERQYLTPQSFRPLSAFAGALEEKMGEDKLAHIEVLENEVHAHFESDFILIFLLSDDAANVLERLTLALEAKPFTEHKLSDFEYLDLRFGDKLYYKLK